MIYPGNSAEARLAAAQMLADRLMQEAQDGDPILDILVAGHIKNEDVIFAQKECSNADSIKLANMLYFMSMMDRAHVVLPDGTDTEIADLLAREGIEVDP